MINFVGWGMAGRYGNEILLHESLNKPEYTALKQWILAHELQHTSGQLTKEDLLLDLKDHYIKPKEISALYLKFFFSEPGAWKQSLPCVWYDGRLWWDVPKLIGGALTALVGGMFLVWLL